VRSAVPFTISGSKIQAIFADAKVWRKLGGAVELIVFKGHDSKGASTFQITTTEANAIKDSLGRTTGYVKQPCLITVDVSNTGDEMVPKWTVSRVDDSTCPVVR
jgi:hypothetical protein